MPRRKRGNEEDEESSPPKRQKAAPVTRRSTQNTASKESPIARANVNQPPKRGTSSKSTYEDAIEISSDSSSLSDPPSRFTSPTPPKPSPPQSVKNETKAKRAPAKQSTGVKKVSSKEHEDALDLFVRDDSEDEFSDVSSEDVQMRGDEFPDLSSDDEDDDWEDVDLSHKKMSLDDLNGSTETPDLEVTLERTQLSMRIKYNFSVTALTSRNKASSAAERKIRMHTHLLHIQCLLVHGAIRNAWLEDKALQVDTTYGLVNVRMTYSPRFQT
jgi:hypothetical protein